MSRRVPLEIETEDDRNLIDWDRVSFTQPSDEAQQNWLLRRTVETKKKNLNYKILLWSVIGAILGVSFIAGMTKFLNRHHPPPAIDKYTLSLRKALLFFNEQKSGKFTQDYKISWRGDSCMTDGIPNSSVYRDLSGGFYDGGDATKHNFPQSFSITMLSWSTIEYGSKFEAAGELDHVKELIKWGTDYLLKTFDSGAKTISGMAIQVGKEDGCWMRPEDINGNRNVELCCFCSDLAAEMAAALASASIVFRNDNPAYSQKLVQGATTLFQFARGATGKYSDSSSGVPYKSTGYFDEFIWGASWLFCATGDEKYLSLATDRKIASDAGVFFQHPNSSIVLSWDNKLAGALVLLTRVRLFLSPGYPYEEVLSTIHSQTNKMMCSYLPDFPSFNRTKGGLIQLNNGRPQPLQYVVNAAFLASLFSDYLEASGQSDVSGWYCGPTFYTTDKLHEFAAKQISYILGENPRQMSYLVGFGNHYPRFVHHQAASIPYNKIKFSCQGGFTWRDSLKPNPNILEGAMVAGPDKREFFFDVRTNSNYTAPTLAGNSGLVAATVSLSGDRSLKINQTKIFSAFLSKSPSPPPPPPPWLP